MQPLVFEPYLRPQVWGGRRLLKLFHKKLPDDGNYGEAWELSGHPHHVSKVAEGPLQGTLLTTLCREYGNELFGDHLPPDEKFPLLIKLLDCNELLSIQVHPNDEIAAQILGDEKGKTEAWVILDVGPDGRVYAGLREGVTKEELEKHLAAGTTDQCLHSFRPKPGDCLFIQAGTVHAVGGGVVIAEVQQSSDATFRLFDWNRLGTDGKPRQLHLQESLQSIDFDAGPLHPVEPRKLTGMPEGVDGEFLAACPYFQMERYAIERPFKMPYVGKLSIWMVLAGKAELRSGDYERTFETGETVLIPATSGPLRWESERATLLGVTLPS